MKTKNQFTPGRWETGAVMTRVEVQLPGWRVPMTVADCHPEKGYCPSEESERVANASLISAAPDLLAALERIVELSKADGVAGLRLDLCADTAHAALNKARGQQ
jgi:hypothetical protein